MWGLRVGVDITDRMEGESSGHMDLLIRKRMSGSLLGFCKKISGL